jgi:hypothetical protein
MVPTLCARHEKNLGRFCESPENNGASTQGDSIIEADDSGHPQTGSDSSVHDRQDPVEGRGGGSHRRTFGGMGGVGACGTETVSRTVTVERLAAGDHACLGFDSHEDRWAVRAAFTAAGLARGERVMLFTERGVSGGEALCRLAAHGVPADSALSDGRLSVVSRPPGYDPARGLDAAARTDYWSTATGEALACGFSGLRAAGDMSWAVEPEVARDDLASYEDGLTPLFARLAFTGMCEFDRRVFPPAVFRRVLAAHPLSVLPALGTLRACREGDTLQLTGDADLATRGEFELSLIESVRKPGLAVIDLTGLDFIDAYCVRQLLRLPVPVAMECTAAQYRLLRLCGAAQADGVDLRLR